uniref:Uncharacterized protein n=1 Tax=Kalanchoe fedtschenkoi TaxID=63787 RepID=A0A7N0T868_KALFE
MGSLIGHVAPGLLGFFLIGLWHLFNHIKLHLLHPYTYKQWLGLRYLELYLIILGSCASVAMELFISPRRHQPLDTDGSTPSNHLHNFEHSSISSALIVYGVFSILLDKMKTKSQLGLTHLLGALAFAQELFLFHLHSTDHMGVEGQYHTLLQISKEVDEGLQYDLEILSSSSGTGSDEDLESQKGADSHVDERKSFIHGKIKPGEK